MAQYNTETRLTRRNAAKLLKLAAFLRALPPKLFDFGSICKLGAKSPLDAYAAGGGCGTTACALGWTPKVFPRAMKWDIRSDMEDGDYISISLKKSPSLDNFYAASRFFGVSHADVLYMFNPRTFKGDGAGGLAQDAPPKVVARRIEAFVRRFGPAA